MRSLLLSRERNVPKMPLTKWANDVYYHIMRRQQEDRKRFGSESEVCRLTGIARATLQKHRILGRGFPFYRVGSRILYDLDEVESIIRRARVGCGGAA